MAARDDQRGRLYGAESTLRQLMLWSNDTPGAMAALPFGVSVPLPPEAKFGNLESIQRYVETVLTTGSVVATFGRHPVPGVRERRGQQRAHYETDGTRHAIAIPDGRPAWVMRETVVLHEVAHHLDRDLGDQHGAHGRSFANTFATLLGLVMGPQAELAMRVLYDSADVVHRV